MASNLPQPFVHFHPAAFRPVPCGRNNQSIGLLRALSMGRQLNPQDPFFGRRVEPATGNTCCTHPAVNVDSQPRQSGLHFHGCLEQTMSASQPQQKNKRNPGPRNDDAHAPGHETQNSACHPPTQSCGCVPYGIPYLHGITECRPHHAGPWPFWPTDPRRTWTARLLRGCAALR